MGRKATDKVFPEDRMTKRERVLATLRHQAVDRAAIMEQLSYNPRVIAHYTGRPIKGFEYTLDDICQVIRKTTDIAMPPNPPRGTRRVRSPDGFVTQHDNWTSWHVSRPFTDERGARDWLLGRIAAIRSAPFDPGAARSEYARTMRELQHRVGETVILDISSTGFCAAFDAMGLEIFTYFVTDYPEVFAEYMGASAGRELRRIRAVADPALSPVVLVAEDFATKQGPIFSPDFLHEYHFPHLRDVVEAWHQGGLEVLYHSDGNWKKVIPDLIQTGVDGFYCLEKSCGMDIVELKNAWPQMVWSGGVDGVDLMERGTPGEVRMEVQRHIRDTHALETGGMFVASSSEINPPIPPQNYVAMIEAVGALRNPDFYERR